MGEMGLSAQQCEQWPEFRHTFSHYHLDITPVFLQVAKVVVNEVAEAPQTLWYQPDGAQQQIGLSAVAVKLIEAASDGVSKGMGESGKLPL